MSFNLELLEYGWQAFVQRNSGRGPRPRKALPPKDAYVAGARAAFGIVCLAIMGGGDEDDVLQVFQALDAELTSGDDVESERAAGAAR